MISLNPKKLFFGLNEVKLLGHKYGVRSYPTRVEGIQHLTFSPNKMEIQSFFGKINFIKKFIMKFLKLPNPFNPC